MSNDSTHNLSGYRGRDIVDAPTEPPSTPSEGTKAYIGTKVILAKPMSEHDFLLLHKGVTEEELKMRETMGPGYLVIYEDGYKSWSPKDVFERCYREVTNSERRLVFPSL